MSLAEPSPQQAPSPPQTFSSWGRGKRVSHVDSPEPPPQPFLKWAGGKGQLLEQYEPLFPRHRRYFEPFLGGGAMFFHLAPREAVLSDLNARLVGCYQVVRDDVHALVELLRAYRAHHNEVFYYETRRRYNEEISLSPTEQAAMFIYLNKTGFNGLYRENSRGGFNVPFGRYRNPAIFSEDNLVAASRALRHATLRSAPFDACLDEAREGDFVYFDPPYQPLSRTADFTAYTRSFFGDEDQQRLATVFRTLHERGCRVMLSNSDTPRVQELYDGFYQWEVKASRSINCNGAGRGAITELVVTNYCTPEAYQDLRLRQSSS